MYSQQMFNEYDQGTGKDLQVALQSAICRSTYLPAANAKQEAHDIALLLLLKLLEIFVSTHL